MDGRSGAGRQNTWIKAENSVILEEAIEKGRNRLDKLWPAD